MVGAQLSFPYRDGASEQRRGLLILPLRDMHGGQVIQRERDLKMINAKDLFLDL